MTVHPQSDQTDRRFQAGTAYTTLGERIGVFADRERGIIELEVAGKEYMLNLGHLEQLDNAVRRALIWMAIR